MTRASFSHRAGPEDFVLRRGCAEVSGGKARPQLEPLACGHCEQLVLILIE